MPIIICKVCGKKKQEKLSRIKIGKGKYCSKACYDYAQRGDNRKDRWKGTYINCQSCKKELYVIPSQRNIKKYCSRECFSVGRKGTIVSKETKQKMREASVKLGIKPPSCKGKKQTKEHIEKRISKIRGEKNYFWKGGVTSLRKKIRNIVEYKIWRSLVFQRDNYTCVFCGYKGRGIQADHKKQVAEILQEHNIRTLEQAINCHELWDINNGRTLCISCHKNTPTFMNRWFQNNKIEIDPKIGK